VPDVLGSFSVDIGGKRGEARFLLDPDSENVTDKTREIAGVDAAQMARQPRLASAHYCAGNDAVRRKHPLVFASHLAIETQVGGHVLPAGVRASGKVDREFGNLVEVKPRL